MIAENKDGNMDAPTHKWRENTNTKISKKEEQARAELGQAQIQLELSFTCLIACLPTFL